MPRKSCNITLSSKESEKSCLLQKSKTGVDEHERNLKAKGSANTQVYLLVFPGLDGMKQCLRCFEECTEGNLWVLLSQYGQMLIQGSHTRHACLNSTVFEYPTDLVDFCCGYTSASNYTPPSHLLTPPWWDGGENQKS